ncbi:ectoine synthase [Amycolatopsis marina]|uniref:L-ectoine synthase n=1 Tax=Amycolatopsis marina TaxID=490629 RepID=A0A1I1AQV5_9PSEU|nr:ectoine synthase [Amycolatopsis marina]SFB40415.1 ectoine synthase [Amycolatopsis marina]
MIVRTIAEINETEADVKTANWRSKRLILAGDKVGFSMHETTLYAGTVNQFWYANHVEAVFVVEGEGELVDSATGEVFQLRPGTMYLLNNQDKHEVRPTTDVRAVCVFNPPVTGREVHDENGVYPLITEAD